MLFASQLTKYPVCMSTNITKRKKLKLLFLGDRERKRGKDKDKDRERERERERKCEKKRKQKGNWINIKYAKRFYPRADVCSLLDSETTDQAE